MNYYYRAVVKFSNRGLVRGYKKVWGSLIYSIVLWRSNGNFYNMFTESCCYIFKILCWLRFPWNIFQ